MFIKPKNANSAQWFGDVPGIEGAMKIYGADTAYAYSEFERILRGYLFRYEKLYYDFYNKQLQEIIGPLLLKTNGNGPKEIENIRLIFHEMRLIKDDDEIKLIRKAVEITCDAHLEAFKMIKPEMYEYEIAAIFSYIFEKKGSISKGYAPIIASALNPLAILHITFSPRRGFDVPSIHHEHFKAPLFQQFVDRNPVHAGRFQGHGVDAALHEPID